MYSFRTHGSHSAWFVNVAVRELPWFLPLVPFDVIVFHTTLLSSRWIEDEFHEACRRIAPLARSRVPKVAIPQDEFLRGDLLCWFIETFRVDRVLSIFPPTEWPKIYRDVDRERVQFEQVLAGYLDERLPAKLDRLGRRVNRTVDIGYRAWHAAPWIGRQGLLKVRIAEEFAGLAGAVGVEADISTRGADVFLGDAWYEFLLRCKYTLGVEGGSSLLDYDGSARARTDAYMAEHPDAGFEEIEAACFPGQDGSLDAHVITPRHLEAAATRTCQILVEGDYNGVLQAGVHYHPVKRDFSNVAEVLAAVKCDVERAALTERTYQDVVASGKYTYRAFVDAVLGGLPLRSEPTLARVPSWLVGALFFLNELLEWLAWRRLAFRARAVAPAKRVARRCLPPAVHSSIRRVLRRGA